MARRSTALKGLLRQRHWQTYGTFCRQYDIAARRVDTALIGHWPSRGQFARWLAGDLKGLPHAEHCLVLEAMFPGLTADQLFTTGDPPAAAPVSLPAARPEIPAQTQSHDDVSPDLGHPRVRPDPILEPADTMAGQVSGHSLHEEIAMATEESARFVRAPRGSVDSDVLDQLGTDVRHLAVEYLMRPPLTLFRPLSGLRREVFDLLDRRQRPALMPPLYGVAGRLCALLAHASADLGHSYAAETHTRTAWLCADLADDDSLRAYVRWVQANIAFWNGDFRRAAEVARNGQQYARSGSNLVRLASQEARAWAACGEQQEVERTLSLATTARDRDVPDGQAGVFRFDPGKAAYYESEIRLAQGGTANARRSVASAQEALQLFELGPEDHRSPEFVAAARLDLANAHLALDDLDAAAGQLRIVLRLPVESRTQPIVGRVTSAGETLSTPKFTRSALALDLREEIGLFRAYPARRELPEVPD